MGFRDVYNKLKGMAPMAQTQAKRLAQAAMAPAVLGAGVGSAVRTITNRAKPTSNVNYNRGQVQTPFKAKMQRFTPMPTMQAKAKRPR